MADFQANLVEEEIECMFICFDDAVDLEEHFEDLIQLAGRLVADQELSESLVNKILQQAWNGFGVVHALKAKPNVYSITGNPLFVKGYTFSIKPWLLSNSLDDICANHAIY
ncbi:hypothetical protein D8674_037607 [Pyrus ussuriensis x Pyrus communis]|uniref:Uncharacterized protein n=1 Tax=Pyrus ussuriensis x Pyrus communis TaxID=2448454 RepID=A0A5N5H6Y4_9ROSA|nr:hypothetical protein D8674_037607 [Pyrus ussuriensis x Pyrus communis]